ncbi:MAG TPA: hypothetical protein VNF91_09000 [Candidatus Acidoferrum sp.]|nr:hypothetical protein [Candidatus Acidoferrum sp.]
MSDAQFSCPFCGRRVVAHSEPQAVMHEMPMCPKFEAEEPLMFLRNARVAMVGRMPDDDEWPVTGGGSE